MQLAQLEAEFPTTLMRIEGFWLRCGTIPDFPVSNPDLNCRKPATQTKTSANGCPSPPGVMAGRAHTHDALVEQGPAHAGVEGGEGVVEEEDVRVGVHRPQGWGPVVTQCSF